MTDFAQLPVLPAAKVATAQTLAVADGLPFRTPLPPVVDVTTITATLATHTTGIAAATTLAGTKTTPAQVQATVDAAIAALPPSGGGGGGGGLSYASGYGIVVNNSVTPPTISVAGNVLTDDSDPGAGGGTAGGGTGGGTSSGTVTLTQEQFNAMLLQATAPFIALLRGVTTTEPATVGDPWINNGVLSFVQG